ncbi:MAG: hypothetical protein NBV65_07495 [Burkholderiaceae bacterium]|nr:hypothetical protein [Burkholderiaceae bacterium]
MDRIENFSRVWDNGAVSSDALPVQEILRLKQATGAKKVIGTKWKHSGKTYEFPFYARLLRDQTGLVYFQNDDIRTGCLVVRNGNGSERALIKVPRINVHSCPEKGYLSLPPSSAHFGEIEWGCEGNDGYTDYLFDFDWNTGKLLRYARPTRPW